MYWDVIPEGKHLEPRYKILGIPAKLKLVFRLFGGIYLPWQTYSVGKKIVSGGENFIYEVLDGDDRQRYILRWNYSYYVPLHQEEEKERDKVVGREIALSRAFLDECFHFTTNGDSRHQVEALVVPNRPPDLFSYMTANVSVDSKKKEASDLAALLTLNALLAVVAALTKLHVELRCVHLDFNAKNVLYQGGSIARLIDFGRNIPLDPDPDQRLLDKKQKKNAVGKRKMKLMSHYHPWFLATMDEVDANVNYDLYALGMMLLDWLYLYEQPEYREWAKRKTSAVNAARAGDYWHRSGHLPLGSEGVSSASTERKSKLSGPHSEPLLADDSKASATSVKQSLTDLADDLIKSVELKESGITLEKAQARLLKLRKKLLLKIESQSLWRKSFAQVFPSSLYGSWHDENQRYVQLAYYHFVTGNFIRDYFASPVASFFGLSSLVKAWRDYQNPKQEDRSPAWALLRLLFHTALDMLVVLPFNFVRSFFKLVFECLPAYAATRAQEKRNNKGWSWFVVWGFFRFLQLVAQQVLSPLNAAAMWHGRFAVFSSLFVSSVAIVVSSKVVLPFFSFFIAVMSPVWWISEALAAFDVQLDFLRTFSQFCRTIDVGRQFEKLLGQPIFPFIAKRTDLVEDAGEAFNNIAAMTHLVSVSALLIMVTWSACIAVENKCLYGSFFGYNQRCPDQAFRLKARGALPAEIKIKNGEKQPTPDEERYRIVDGFRLGPSAQEPFKPRPEDLELETPRPRSPLPV